MYAPLFALLNADAAVKAKLGSNPLRVYPAGEAPSGVARPYLVYQTYSGVPQQYLGSRSDMDAFGVQLDIYADTVDEAREAARPVRNCLEKAALITALREPGRDPETKRLRYGMDVAFLTPR